MDNLDYACAVIEKAAMDKAVPDIDEQLASAYLMRRKNRDVRILKIDSFLFASAPLLILFCFDASQRGQPFVDHQIFTNPRFPASLPDGLRIRQPGLTQHQLRVYDEFARSRYPQGKLLRQLVFLSLVVDERQNHGCF
jgi:CCR4-NOT transcription complex subunit 1